MHIAPLTVAVVGAGRFGALHALKLAAVPGVRVAAVVDPAADRAQAVAAAVGARACAELDELPPVEAATVVVPVARLAPVASALLARGVHVLVEKPMATTRAEAQALVTAAARADRVLAVGYLERFNPALAAFHIDGRLVSRRVGPRAADRLDLDWLVHDLDLARFLLRSELEVVSARQGPGWQAVRVAGAGGVARHWVQEGLPVRRRLWGAPGRLDLRGPGDPLGRELAAFCAAVRGAALGPLAAGADGVAALALVEQAAQLAQLAHGPRRGPAERG